MPDTYTPTTEPYVPSMAAILQQHGSIAKALASSVTSEHGPETVAYGGPLIAYTTMADAPMPPSVIDVLRPHWHRRTGEPTLTMVNGQTIKTYRCTCGATLT